MAAGGDCELTCDGREDALDLVAQGNKDGDGDHSPFAASLIKRLQDPMIEINKLFRLVTGDVLRATRDSGSWKPETRHRVGGGISGSPRRSVIGSP